MPNAESVLLEIKAGSVATVKELETQYKAYAKRVADVQAAIRLWRSRGWFDRQFLSGMETRGSSKQLVGEYNEARALAREAVKLGGRILRSATTLGQDPAIKEDSKAVGKLNKIKREMAKSMPPLQEMAKTSDLVLFFKRKKWTAILAIGAVLAYIAGFVALVLSKR